MGSSLREPSSSINLRLVAGSSLSRGWGPWMSSTLHTLKIERDGSMAKRRIGELAKEDVCFFTGGGSGLSKSLSMSNSRRNYHGQ